MTYLVTVNTNSNPQHAIASFTEENAFILEPDYLMNIDEFVSKEYLQDKNVLKIVDELIESVIEPYRENNSDNFSWALVNDDHSIKAFFDAKDFTLIVDDVVYTIFETVS